MGAETQACKSLKAAAQLCRRRLLPGQSERTSLGVPADRPLLAWCTTLPPSASTLSSASATSTTAKAPADLERELGEVALDLGDEPAAAHDLTHLGPLAHNVLGQGHAEDVGHSRRAIGLVLIRVHSDHVP